MASDELNQISLRIVQSAIKVHRALGPGLLEGIYEKCLAYEVTQRGSVVLCEHAIPIRYEGLVLDGLYRIDMIVDDRVIVEVKSVEQLLPVHHAQLLSYLRLTNKQLGLLINFNVPVLAKGIKRVINGYGDA